MIEGWSLLLCHGKGYYDIQGLDYDRTITVDNSNLAEPDFRIDIARYRCKKCPIFDNVIINGCPLGGSEFYFYHVITEIALNVLKPGGMLFTTDYGFFTKKTLKILGLEYVPYSDDFQQLRAGDNPKNTKGKSLGWGLASPGDSLNLKAYKKII
jgi:hypothetical protein